MFQLGYGSLFNTERLGHFDLSEMAAFTWIPELHLDQHAFGHRSRAGLSFWRHVRAKHSEFSDHHQILLRQVRPDVCCTGGLPIALSFHTNHSYQSCSYRSAGSLSIEDRKRKASGKA